MVALCDIDRRGLLDQPHEARQSVGVHLLPGGNGGGMQLREAELPMAKKSVEQTG